MIIWWKCKFKTIEIHNERLVFRLLQLVAMFMSIWWTAAGFIHLIGAIFLFIVLALKEKAHLLRNAFAVSKQFHENLSSQKTTGIPRISQTVRTSPTSSKNTFSLFKNTILLWEIVILRLFN